MTAKRIAFDTEARTAKNRGEQKLTRADKNTLNPSSRTVYAEAIFSEGLKNVASGANPTQIQRGIQLAVDAIVDELKKMSKKVENSQQVAQVGASSANQDKQIGDMIAEAMDKVGKDGVITVEEG